MNDTVELRKSVPVLRNVDVAVAGCGISGLFASLGAAKQGAKVLVVDRMPAPGGNIGPGMIVGYGIGKGIGSHLEGGSFPGVIGDFMARLDRHLDDVPYIYATMSHAASRVALEMFDELGVEVVLSAYASDPITEGNRVSGLFIETKSGTVAVRAKVVIDATGDADIAMRAGAPIRRVVPAADVYPVAETEASRALVSGLNPTYRNWNDGQVYFYVGEADLWKYIAFCRETRQLSPEQALWAKEHLRTWSGWPNPMVPLLQEGWESGQYRVEREIRPNVHVALNNWFSISMARPGHVGGRAGVFGDYDTGNWEDVSMMEKEVRSIVYDGITFFRKKKVPGFENAYLLSISPFLGARGGPFIEGEHVMTPQEARAGCRSPDALYVSRLGHMPHLGDPAPAEGFDMPYAMVLPKAVEGLFVTGRGAAFVRRGHDPSFRERSNMMALGQAVGIAAALCAAKGNTPRSLDRKTLQRALLDAGCCLGDEKRLTELGLR